MESKPENMNEVLTAIQEQRALSALGAASGSKSAQKQRAERQAVVAKMLEEGLSRAEIVRRTGFVDHLVGYDIDCLRKRRAKQGAKRVFAVKPPKARKVDADHPPSDVVDRSPIVDEDGDESERDEPSNPETSAAPAEPSSFVGDKPGLPGVVRPGCSVGRDQLKLAMKAFKRGERKSSLFITTKDNNHNHVADLDILGDGETVKDSTGHKHRICHFELLESDHTHGITLQEPSEAFRRSVTG